MMYAIVYRDGLVCGSTCKSAIDATAPLDGPREAIDAFAQRFFQTEQAKYCLEVERMVIVIASA